MENTKNEIISLYFSEHLKVKEIAEKINVSSAYITKLIKKDTRYMQEKEFRQKIQKQKRRLSQNEFIKKKREKQRIEDNYLLLQEQHNQAVRELSQSSHLTNENYRKWNISAYKYNPSKNRYEFDKALGRSYDVPEFIKER